jgi:biopolymer transport protein ExbB
MSFILIAFVLGLSVAIERILYLNFSTVNTEKFLNKIEDSLNSGNIAQAQELCAKTRGPVAVISFNAIERQHQGIEIVEKTIISTGSVEAARLEKGLTWISLFISLSPMLGFLGTVLGMVEAFDAIEAAGDISPVLVAGGIKVALITTVGGLIAAMILQVFYNYIVSKIDKLIMDMEESSVTLVDLLVRYQTNE